MPSDAPAVALNIAKHTHTLLSSAFEAACRIADVIYPALAAKMNALVAKRLFQIDHVQDAEFMSVPSPGGLV
jgi:hypothetical protein